MPEHDVVLGLAAVLVDQLDQLHCDRNLLVSLVLGARCGLIVEGRRFAVPLLTVEQLLRGLRMACLVAAISHELLV